ncbi:MAG: copper resistance CopC family protein [Pseudonocardiaceae bacterium]
MSGRAALRISAGTLSCAVLGLLAGSDQASASAGLISTDPGQGAVVATIPTGVTLTFDEPVVVTADGVQVFGPNGAEVDDGHPEHLAGSATVGVRLSGMNQPSSALQGTYTVVWRVISADSDQMWGEFSFSVVHRSTNREPTNREPSRGRGPDSPG